MRHILYSLLIVMACTAITHAAPIAVTNASFESGLTGWTVYSDGNLNSNGVQVRDDKGTTDGTNALWADGYKTDGTDSDITGAGVAQTIGTVTQAGDIYILTYDYWKKWKHDPIEFNAEILIEGVQASITTQVHTDPRDVGNFKTISVSYTTVAGDVGKSIDIRLLAHRAHAGSPPQPAFDNVRVDYVGVPEPASMTLGVTACAWMCRRKR